jgi:ABC-type amino acid transport substrate-binding protein
MSRSRKMTVAAMLSSAALCALALHGTARAADQPPAAAPLRVGIAPNYPPLAFKQDGKLVGIEVDFANRLGEALGRPVVLVETPWEELPKALLEDKTIDVVMSGTSITEKRKKKVDFTTPYLQVGQMVLIRAADYPKIRSAHDLDHKRYRVGFTTKTTSAHYARAHLGNATLRGFSDTDAAVAALRSGEIDALIADAPAVWRVTGGFMSKETELRGLYQPLTKEYLAWAVRKSDTQLRHQLDAVLAKWKKDGTIDEVLNHWIRVRRTSLELKPQP